jgi:hypothetical protein
MPDAVRAGSQWLALSLLERAVPTMQNETLQPCLIVF